MSYAFLKEKSGGDPRISFALKKKAKEERGYPFLSVFKSLCDPIILGSLEIFKITEGEFCKFLWWRISGGWSEDGISGRGAEIPCISTRGIYKLRPPLYPRYILFESPCFDDDLYTICVENQLSGWRISVAGFPGYIRRASGGKS